MRHRRMVAPINSIKHFVPRTNLTVTSGSGSSLDIVEGVVAPATSAVSDVIQGAVVKAVHLEFWLWGAGTTGLDTQFTFIVEKVPSGAGAATAAEMLSLGSYDNKKNVLFTTQGVLGAGVDGNQAVPIIRDWLLIPKGKQRIGLSDKITVGFTPTGTSMQFCGMAIFKEYR